MDHVCWVALWVAACDENATHHKYGTEWYPNCAVDGRWEAVQCTVNQLFCSSILVPGQNTRCRPQHCGITVVSRVKNASCVADGPREPRSEHVRVTRVTKETNVYA
ncbi:hypothetical protein DIPPA_12118 [Diplonema papillatum]|nr:hypothetical protein DIPPA_12118 [Diplonema papillatum]